MKKQIAFLSVLMLISLISCAPQDREVVSKEDRDKILSQRGKAPSDGVTVEFGTYGLAAFLMEKQGEILQLLVLSDANSGESRGGYTLLETTSRNSEVRHLNLNAEASPILHRGFTTTQKAAWDFSVVGQPGLQTFDGSLKESKFQLVNAKAGKAFMKAEFEENVAKISAAPLNDGSNLHQVTYKSMGFWKITKSGITEIILFTIDIAFQADLRDLSSPSIQILNAVSKTTSPRPKYGINMTLKSAPSELKFMNEKECPRVLGSSLLDGKLEVVLDEKAATVKTKRYYAANGDCGSRPLVDLNRVLIY